MSRSYKKTPVSKDSAGAKDGKKEASRAVRRDASGQISKGGAYKKAYESWDISDFKFRMTEKEFRAEWERENGPADQNPEAYKRALFEWKKKYVQK